MQAVRRGRSRIRSGRARRDSRPSAAGRGTSLPSNCCLCLVEAALEGLRGGRAGATGPMPRRRAANSATAGREIGVGLGRPTRARPALRCGPGGAATSSGRAMPPRGFSASSSPLRSAHWCKRRSLGPVRLSEHHPDRRLAIRAGGRERHRFGLVGLARPRLGEPIVEQLERVAGHVLALRLGRGRAATHLVSR